MPDLVGSFEDRAKFSKEAHIIHLMIYLSMESCQNSLVNRTEKNLFHAIIHVPLHVHISKLQKNEHYKALGE